MQFNVPLDSIVYIQITYTFNEDLDFYVWLKHTDPLWQFN